MSQSGKRIFTELNRITIENGKNPASKKFIIDQNPFHDDESEPPTITMTKEGPYYVVIGRILPTSNVYNKSAFKVEIKIPGDFPFKPPEVKMLTTIHHPNIGPEGRICIPMLRSTENWRSKNSLMDVITALVDHIDHPNIDEAHSKEIGEQYTNRRAEFDRQVSETIQRNMLPRD